MIAFLKGKIAHLLPLKTILDVHGVGYEVNISLATSEMLEKKDPDSEVLLHTRAVYSENSHSLYGFLNRTEVELFDFLVSLHGIGPKIVMSILSYCPVDEFLKSLKNGDSSLIVRVPGIGKTKAEKIIFESKSRIKKLDQLLSGMDSTFPEPTGNAYMEQIFEALDSLGFSSKEVLLAEKKIIASGESLPEKTPENSQAWLRLFLKLL